MIRKFIGGPSRVMLFVFSKPKYLLILFGILLTIIGFFIFPGSLYISPFYLSVPNNHELYLIENPCSSINCKISIPEWIVPSEENRYSITIQMVNDENKDVIINVKIYIDNIFLQFIDYDVLPIEETYIIPAGKTKTVNYIFTYKENSNHDKNLPISLTFISNDSQNEVNGDIPIYYFIIPVFSIIGLIITIVSIVIPNLKKR